MRNGNKLRFVSMLLLLALFFSFVACDSSSTPAETSSNKTTAPETSAPSATSESQTTEPESSAPATTATVHRSPNFEVTTWNGENFRIIADSDVQIARGEIVEDTRARDIIYLEDAEVNNINEAVRDRNLYIEDTYDVKIKAVWNEDPHLMAIKSCASALDVGDIVETSYDNYVNLINNGQLMDMNVFNNYLDMTNSCWDQTCVRDMSIAHRLFCCSGDILVTDKMGCWCILFNRDMINNYQLKSLYDVVDEGEWTYDVCYQYAKAVSDYSSHDPKDLYNITWGITTEPSNTYFIWQGCGVKLIRKDPVTDIPYLGEISENASDAMIKACTLQADRTVSVHNNDFAALTKETFNDGTIRVFQEGHAMFFIGSMTIVESMRKHDTDFGVLPMPKINKEQSTYYAAQSNTRSFAVAIPADGVKNSDFVGMILQALAVESTDTLLEAYYDKTLVYKGLRREEDERMLDLIVKNRIYDLTLMTTWADALVSDLGNVTNEKRMSSLTGKYDKYKTNCDQAISKFLEKFGYV